MGDCRPHAYIFAALLEKAGISAEFVNLQVTHQKKTNGQWESPITENHTVVVAKLEGTEYILDSFLDHFHKKPFDLCASENGYEDETTKIKINSVNSFPKLYHPVQEVFLVSPKASGAIVERTTKELPAENLNLENASIAPSQARRAQ